MGVDKVSGADDSVGDGITVEVNVGAFVAVGNEVAEGVAVSGEKVDKGVSAIGVAGSAVNVVRFSNEG